MPLALALLALAQTSWKTYTLPPGFTVQLPNKPVAQKVPDQPAGSKYWLVNRPDGAFLVVYAPVEDANNPSATTDQLLAAAVLGYVEEDTLLSQRDVLHQGWPAIEFTSRDAEGIRSWSRVVIAKGRMYQVVTTTEQKSGAMAGDKRFLDSLRLPTSVGKGPLTTPGPQFRSYTLPENGVTVSMPGTPKADETPLPNNPLGLKMRRHAAVYGNRAFLAATVEVPEEMAEQATEERIPALLEKLNEEVASGFQAKVGKSRVYQLQGQTALSTDFSFGKGQMAGRVDSIFHKGRMVMFVTAVPTALRAAPEVASFFKSVSLGAK